MGEGHLRAERAWVQHCLTDGHGRRSVHVHDLPRSVLVVLEVQQAVAFVQGCVRGEVHREQAWCERHRRQPAAQLGRAEGAGDERTDLGEHAIASQHQRALFRPGEVGDVTEVPLREAVGHQSRHGAVRRSGVHVTHVVGVTGGQLIGGLERDPRSVVAEELGAIVDRLSSAIGAVDDLLRAAAEVAGEEVVAVRRDVVDGAVRVVDHLERRAGSGLAPVDGQRCGNAGETERDRHDSAIEASRHSADPSCGMWRVPAD